ncbi:MAG TPA: mechanosensitive ion channel family protein [Bryobacteraceae bacterium]|nr:mechanosensitive ion channel family protein [Bryobacteraceae bacterium]
MRFLPVILHHQLPYILAACAVISGFIWKFVLSERRRATTTLQLLVVAAVFWLSALETNLRWLWEISLALAEIGVVQIAAILIFRFALWRLRAPLIVRDVFLAICYAVVLLATLSRFGTNVLGIVATSTVITAIIGLSLQDTLLNVIGGMVLHAEGVIGLHDYVKTEHHGEGWVRTVRTRYTSLETPEGDLVLVPNNFLMKNAVTVIRDLHREVISFNLSYEHAPMTICELVETALRDSAIPGVAATPPPQCVVLKLHPTHIEYGAVVWETEAGSSINQVSSILTRVYYSLARAGHTLSAVARRVNVIQAGEREPDESQDRQLRIDALRENEIFGVLSQQELEFLAEHFVRMVFAGGEAVVKQGDEGDCLYLVMKGRARVVLSGADNRSEEVATLGPGSILGEMSLLSGEKRSASVVAEGHLECDRLDKADFARILRERPEVADQISIVLTARQSGLSEARDRLNAVALDTRQDFLMRIQAFFGLGKKALETQR